MKHFNIEICNLCMLLNYKLKQDHIIKFGIIKKKKKKQRIPLQLEQSSKQPHIPVDHFPLVGSCGVAIF